MYFLVLTGRHFLRHWRLNLAILFGLTLAAGLLAGLPAYAASMAAHSLEATLHSHDTLPAERNLEVSSNVGSLGITAYAEIEEALGKDLLVARVEVREDWVNAVPPGPNPVDLEKALRFQVFHLWSFEGKFEEAVRVVQGRLPRHTEPPQGDFRLPPLEAVVGTDVAEQGRLVVGDRVTGTVGTQVRFVIVGIVEPVDIESDYWWANLQPFRIRFEDRTVMFGGHLLDGVSTLPLILHPQTMRSYFPARGIVNLRWHVLLDWERIGIDNAQVFQESLERLITRLQVRRIQVRSGLPKILADYQTELATARIALFLLSAQALAFVLYTVGMMTSYLLDRSQRELATMAGRGGTRLQITLVFALEGLLLALLAGFLLGPLLAANAIRLYGAWSGNPIPSSLGDGSLLLSLIAAGFGWLAVVFPVYRSTRRGLLEWQELVSRPERLAGWQRYYVDLLLLAFGGLIYWQLSQAGSFVLRRLGSTQAIDPFLLLGSSLLLIAVALILLRIFPLVLSLAAWITKQMRGLVFSLGLARLARSPLGPSRVVLLISLAAGLALFTNSFVSSLGTSQAEIAHYRSGADLRVSRQTAPAAHAQENTADLPGVIVSSPVFRSALQTLDRRPVRLLAIDPQTFPQVAWYPAGTGGPSMRALAALLRQDTSTSTLPGIFSHSAVPRGQGIGAVVPHTIAGQQLDVEIKAIIGEFPTLSDAFVVTDFRALEAQVDLDSPFFPYAGEDWLAIDPAMYRQILSDPELRGRVEADAHAYLSQLQSDATAQGIIGAFHLNTLVLAVLSVAGFLLVHYFAARKRTHEFGLLRAMGLAPSQVFILLVTEGLLAVGLGLLAGTAIGYGLIRLMLPYLSKALSSSLAGVEIVQVIVNWPALGQLYAILAGSYALAMAILLVALMRAGLHRVLRLGEE